MSPAAGGAAPAQSAPAAAIAPPAIATPPEPGRAALRRDPPGQPEGADPSNAAARKTAWNVPAPPPAAAAVAAGVIPGGGGGIIGGDASWPALVESARAWPKSASSDSLKSLSDGSVPTQQVLNLAIKSICLHLRKFITQIYPVLVIVLEKMIAHMCLMNLLIVLEKMIAHMCLMNLLILPGGFHRFIGTLC
jgi:hypothetical protein